MKLERINQQVFTAVRALVEQEAPEVCQVCQEWVELQEVVVVDLNFQQVSLLIFNRWHKIWTQQCLTI